MLAIALGDLGFVGPLNVGLTLLADERGWGASGMGWVLSGFGVGAGAAALLLIVRGGCRTPGMSPGGRSSPGPSRSAPWPSSPVSSRPSVSPCSWGCWRGSAGPCAELCCRPRPTPYLGRVTAVSSLVSLGFAPLSMPLSAAAIEAWGTGPVFVGSAAVCGLGGVVALCVRDLRRAELPG